MLGPHLADKKKNATHQPPQFNSDVSSLYLFHVTFEHPREKVPKSQVLGWSVIMSFCMGTSIEEERDYTRHLESDSKTTGQA